MKSVLFVDVRNNMRSQIAEAWFNHLAYGWGQASSCGTMPAHAIDPRAVQVMREAGIDMNRARPKMVNQQMLARSDIVVIMGRDLYPEALSPTYIWNFLDLNGQPVNEFRALRDAIRQHVADLIDDIRISSIEIESVATSRQWESLMQVVLTH